MELDERILNLIAVGASIGANCRPCLQSNIALALDTGADEQEIKTAIAVGKTVRQCVTEMDKLAARLNQALPAIENESITCCGSTENKS
jgi:AhpD family alkylhydroperoxidase